MTDRSRPRAYYHDTRLELCLAAMKEVADFARHHEHRERYLRQQLQLTDRTKREWHGLYHKLLEENAALVRAAFTDDDEMQVEFVRVQADWKTLVGEHANLQRMYTSMMQDRSSLFDQVQVLKDECKGLKRDVLEALELLKEAQADEA